MKLTVVGSGTAAPEPGRVCSGYLLETATARVLLDCGAGVVHGMARLGLPWPALDHLLVTHFHNDHIGDIPMLLFALKHGLAEPRVLPLTIWGPRGLQARLRAMEAAFGDHVADPGFPLVIREVAPGDAFDAAGLSVRAAPTPHTDHSLAYRFDGGAGPGTEGAVGYTGDTGPSPELALFMEGVAVLVAECSLPDDMAIATHLSPSSLAALATRAAPGRLVVTHVYPQLDALGAVERVRTAGWAGEAVRAEDGLVIETAP